MSEVDAVLGARGKRYGLFTGVAGVAMALKRAIASELSARGKVLDDDQQEALDMVCSKIARIVNGDQDYSDHWLDIAGYAKLVADRLEIKERLNRANEGQLELDLQGGKMNDR